MGRSYRAIGDWSRETWSTCARRFSVLFLHVLEINCIGRIPFPSTNRLATIHRKLFLIAESQQWYSSSQTMHDRQKSKRMKTDGGLELNATARIHLMYSLTVQWRTGESGIVETCWQSPREGWIRLRRKLDLLYCNDIAFTGDNLFFPVESVSCQSCLRLNLASLGQMLQKICTLLMEGNEKFAMILFQDRWWMRTLIFKRPWTMKMQRTSTNLQPPRSREQPCDSECMSILAFYFSGRRHLSRSLAHVKRCAKLKSENCSIKLATALCKSLARASLVCLRQHV